MSFPLLEYLRRECGPFWRTIVFDRQILIGIGAVLLAVRWPGAPVSFTTGRLVEVSLSYGATALGFALTIYTLALTLPQPRVVELLAAHREPGDSKDAYAKLLFVFSWTAFSQCLLVMSAFASQLSVNQASPVRKLAFSVTDSLLYITIFLLAYALLQFLSAILTVAQLGRIISSDARRTVAAKQQRSTLATVKKEGFGR